MHHHAAHHKSAAAQKATRLLCCLVVVLRCSLASGGAAAQPLTSEELNAAETRTICEEPHTSLGSHQQPGAFAVGTGLAAGGGAFTFISTLHEVAERPNHWYTQFDLPRVHFDDYLQYLPATMPFALNLCGIKGEHSLRDLTCLTVLSYGLGGSVARLLKNHISVERPSGLSFNSFPSGHCFVSFVGAELVRREYGSRYPWVAAGAYSLAMLTAFMRFHNNMHWLSDIASGIGLALLSVHLSYWLGEKWVQFRTRHSAPACQHYNTFTYQLIHLQ